MKAAVRYYSRTGNTKKLAIVIAEAIGVEALDTSVPLDEKVDVLFLGSAVYAAGVDDAIKTFVAENKGNIGAICNFSTAALLSSTYKQVQKLAQEHCVQLLKQEFHCRGAFSVMHRNRPNGEDLKRAAAFAKNIVNQN